MPDHASRKPPDGPMGYDLEFKHVVARAYVSWLEAQPDMLLVPHDMDDFCDGPTVLLDLWQICSGPMLMDLGNCAPVFETVRKLCDFIMESGLQYADAAELFFASRREP